MKMLKRTVYGLAMIAGVLVAGYTVSLPLVAAFGPGFGGGGGRGRVPAPEPGAIDVPATPQVTLLTPIDTSTVEVASGPFNGDQGDTQDSIHVQLSSAQAFTDTLIDSLTASGSQRTDTLQSNTELSEDSTYWVRWRDHGVSGGWSAWSTPQSYVNDLNPGQITTVVVVAQTDSSITVQNVTVEDGQGGKANHILRFNTPTVNWGGQFEYDNQLIDSLGTAVGDTVQRVVHGLSASTSYEFQMVAYRGEPEVNAVYGVLSNIASGSTLAGGGGDPVAPSTPSLTLAATSDTNSVQMSGSGYDGENQTHDSTEWRLDNDSDMSSPFYTLTSATELVSHPATDNANLTAGNTYYGDVRYFASSTGWTSRSAIRSVVNAAPGAGCGGFEPPGFTVVRTHDGTAIELSGWTEQLSGPSVHSIEDTVPSAPDGDNTVYRRTYPEGMSMGGVGTDYIFTSGGVLGGTEIYFDYWIRPSSNWLGHPTTGVSKNIYWGSGSFGQQNVMYLLLFGANSAALTIQIRRQPPSPAGAYTFAWNGAGPAHFNLTDANGVSPTKAQATAVRGQWTNIRVHQVANTAGNADGELHVWVGNTKIMEYTGYEFFDDPTTRGWKNDGIYGGFAEGDLSQTQTMDYDDICISVLN